MPRFFNRIRRQLAKENKFFQYSRYAIGEILLVVIGILIALQVNTWNEDRKRAGLEEYYLKSLLSEIKQNKMITEDVIQFYSFKSNNISIVAGPLYQNDTIKNRQEFLAAIVHIGWLYPRPIINNVWNELNATGYSSLIQDKELLRSLTGLYSYFDFVDTVELEWSSYALGYRRLIGDLIPYQDRQRISEYLAVTSLADSYKNDSLDFLVNIDSLVLKMRELESINGYMSDLKSTSRTGELLHDRARIALDSIIHELSLKL